MLKYLFLGALQGFFEWLPVSSEGIVSLASHFLRIDSNPVDTALFLHLGTLLAVTIYFYNDWLKLLKGKNPKLVRFLFITTSISLIIGYPVYKLIKNIFIGNSLLLITGFALLFTAYFNKYKKNFKISNTKLAIISGFLQGLAVIPGLSRSGSTIFGLSLGDFTPREILKISYMMSLPVIIAANILILFQDSSLAFQAWPALITSFLIGITTLHFLLEWMKRINFFKFAVAFSILCFLGAFINFLN